MPADGLERHEALSLRAAAEEAEHDVALVTDQREWTFADLLAAASRLHDGQEIGPLIASGSPEAGRPRRVALWGHRTVSGLLRLYSLLDREDTVTLLHPSWTRDEAQRAMRRVRASVEFDDDGVRPVSRPGSPKPEEQLDEVRGLILFTSGTTSRPKGVVLSRRALIAAAEASARRLGWRAGDRWLLRLPIAHVGGLSIVSRCLAARTTVVLDPSSTFEPRAFIERIQRTGTTMVSLVPTMLHRLVETGLRAPESVRLALIGGAAARPDLLRRAVDLGWPTATTYGMTEACSQIATAEPHDWSRPVDHVGRELDGFEVRLVDEQTLELVGRERAGLLQVRGPALFDGYLGDPVRDPDEWFSTGDWARRGPDGKLRILARRTDLIVTGGENVAPTRVEQALAGHPAVADACVVGVDDPEWGQRVAALLVARPGHPPPGDASLLDDLRSKLSNFEIPRRVLWVDALPNTPAGKVDRRAAQRQLCEGEPDVDG